MFKFKQCTLSTIFPIIFYCFISVKTWDLSEFNISSNYYISSIAIFGNKAFLALPRSSCHNNKTHPTIIEFSWTSRLGDYQITPSKKPSVLLDYQEWDNCDHIQDAIALDFEQLRGKLWILDRGNKKCPAKLIVYNIFQKTVVGYDLEGVAQSNLNSLVVESLGYNPKVYVGFSGGVKDLIIFIINDNVWWSVNLNIPTNFLALARKEPLLYITGGSGEDERGIYSLDIRNLEVNSEVKVVYLGDKLGDSSGLITDLKDGLIYYMIRDYAIVRWDTRHPSEAEFYNILAQSYEYLPYVSQMYTGPYNGIYALINPRGPDNCSSTHFPEIEKRLVKILKYNMFS